MKRFFRFLKTTIEKPGLMNARKMFVPMTAIVIAAMDGLLLIFAFIVEKSYEEFAGLTVETVVAIIISWFFILFTWYLINEPEDKE